MLPNFLIIGAPRSATTFLSRCASEHPDIYVASSEKYGPGDIHFFDVCTEATHEKRFLKGLEWYQRLFSGATVETAIGEKTATYLCDPKAPELIHQYLPDVRMIAILRNPIDRAYSHYRYASGQIPRNMSFLEACFSDRTKRLILEAGFYYGQILRYLQFFDRSRFIFLVYDDLQSDPLGTFQEVFETLGVDTGFIPAQHDRRINVGLSEQHASYYLRMVGGLVKRSFPHLFTMARRSLITRFLEKKIGRDSDVVSKKPLYLGVSRDDRTLLSEVYYEHDARLSEFLNRDLVGLWHNPVESSLQSDL